VILHKLFDSVSYKALSGGLNASGKRQAAIADNLANINTPHYKRKRVSFETEFRRALENVEGKSKRLGGYFTHPEHIPINPQLTMDEVRPEVYKETYTTWRNDGNNVDLDLEMAEEAKNTIQYQALSNMMGKRLRGMGDLIKDLNR
jgi:flagellar basal-body rod protein FlgB